MSMQDGTSNMELVPVPEEDQVEQNSEEKETGSQIPASEAARRAFVTDLNEED
jgi:hypothetical protein